MDKTQTTVSKGRITKQGVRDLNYYGPRGAKAVAGATVTATVAKEEAAAPEAPPAVTPAVDAHDEDASK